MPFFCKKCNAFIEGNSEKPDYHRKSVHQMHVRIDDFVNHNKDGVRITRHSDGTFHCINKQCSFTSAVPQSMQYHAKEAKCLTNPMVGTSDGGSSKPITQKPTSLHNHQKPAIPVQKEERQELSDHAKRNFDVIASWRRPASTPEPSSPIISKRYIPQRFDDVLNKAPSEYSATGGLPEQTSPTPDYAFNTSSSPKSRFGLFQGRSRASSRSKMDQVVTYNFPLQTRKPSAPRKPSLPLEVDTHGPTNNSIRNQAVAEEDEVKQARAPTESYLPHYKLADLDFSKLQGTSGNNSSALYSYHFDKKRVVRATRSRGTSLSKPTKISNIITKASALPSNNNNNNFGNPILADRVSARTRANSNPLSPNKVNSVISSPLRDAMSAKTSSPMMADSGIEMSEDMRKVVKSATTPHPPSILFSTSTTFINN